MKQKTRLSHKYYITLHNLNVSYPKETKVKDIMSGVVKGLLFQHDYPERNYPENEEEFYPDDIEEYKKAEERKGE